VTSPSPFARAVDALLEATVVPSFSRLGPVVRAPLLGWTEPPSDVLAGRVAVVTGATSGIGCELARSLAALGATVHLVGRDPTKLRRTVHELTACVPSERVVAQRADLTRLDDVRDLADRLHVQTDRIDVLAHVAGALVHEPTITPDGIELTAQVHVVAPFLLTGRLLSLLAATPDARVLTMSSGGMYLQRLDVDTLFDPVGAFDGTRTYAHAKRAQVELNREWARRFPSIGVGFHALHPGWVDTPGLREGLPTFASRLHPLLRTVAQGADTARWLAWTPEATAPGGELWHDRRPRRRVLLPGTGAPASARERLWVECARRADLDPATRIAGPAAASRETS
jgi:NAD(P)-dependent dehydrogenase (short-subunit alcohol dehydrogenase family)